MGKKYTKNALFALAFTAILCGFGREAVDENSQEETIASELAAEETTECAEPSVTQKAAEAKQNKDLTEAFDIILGGATKEYIAGYAIDETFLMWLAAEYGEDAVIRAACSVLDGSMDTECWYENTGDSIHVLWQRFCEAITPGGNAAVNTAKSYSETVYRQETAQEEQAVFAFTGDFNFAKGWYTTDFMREQENGILDCFSEDLLEALKRADVHLMNNEFTYVEADGAIPVEGKAYIFGAEPALVSQLSVFGADLISLANNHTYDYGEKGLLDTMRYLDEAGIPYVGAGKNLDEASEAVSFIVNGRKVAIISATQIERSKQYTKAATEHEAGVFKALVPDRLTEVIAAAKLRNDYVIAVLHWGSEGTLMPDKLQVRLAEQAADAGADAIIGGHPHRLQGAEFIDGVPVAYSLGNFWFSDGTLYTAVAQVVIDADGGLRLQYLPCEQRDMVTRLLTEPEEIDEFYHYLASISTHVGIDADGNVYDKRAEDYPAEKILYDSDTGKPEIHGMVDNEGYAIDIIGNRK